MQRSKRCKPERMLEISEGIRVVWGDAKYHTDVIGGMKSMLAWKKYKSRLRAIRRDSESVWIVKPETDIIESPGGWRA